ncbi:MAG TPA: radical SAM family heme chaperone HemW [Clostridiales bacterium]|nr:radical SAM family heme chaperone HemW [Clostridiales bacterium]
MRKIGLYLHFPFCKQKCHYCDFPSWAGRDDRKESYLRALFREMETYESIRNDYTVCTIYMGGGTPTLFDGDQLAFTLDQCRKCFNVEKDAEVSIECNPGTVDRQKLKTIAASGFNRLSIGLQAWQDRHLEFLGRIHRHRHFEDTVDWAWEAGFTNISVDVILGIPGQTSDEWRETLKNAVKSGVTHLSAYSLKIEEDTLLHHWLEKGVFREMDDEQERKLYHEGIELLQSLGFKQYEISNFALEGFECRHNLNYWRNGEYIGCGCGAHSYFNSKRRGNVADINAYIDRIHKGESAAGFDEEIDSKTEMFETLMLAFRLKEGVRKKDFISRYGISFTDKYKREIELLKQQGLVEEDEESVFPTLLGLDMQNRIALAFLE